jgi:hypothetical protein
MHVIMDGVGGGGGFHLTFSWEVAYEIFKKSDVTTMGCFSDIQEGK